MRFFAKISRSAWLIVGIIGGLILAPAAAVAATFMLLHGANGPAVNASNANQLLTAEAPPSAWESVVGWNDSVGSCSNLPTPNASGGFIVRQVDVDMLPGSGRGTVYLYDGPGCSAGHTFADVDAASGSTVLPFTPGIALPEKGVISVELVGAAAGTQLFVLGYKVPASDVTAPTPAVRCAFTPSACGE
jgi:hypothetical protein